jgi:hypothetical protein
LIKTRAARRSWHCCPRRLLECPVLTFRLPGAQRSVARFPGMQGWRRPLLDFEQAALWTGRPTTDIQLDFDADRTSRRQAAESKIPRVNRPRLCGRKSRERTGYFQPSRRGIRPTAERDFLAWLPAVAYNCGTCGRVVRRWLKRI